MSHTSHLSVNAASVTHGDLRHKVLNALKWTASMRLMSQLLSWLATLWVIRLLVPADYGLLALAQLLVGFATVINQIGLAPALIQAKTASDAVVRSAFGYILATNVVLYVGVYAAAPHFAQLYSAPELTAVVRVLGLQLLIGGLGAVPTALATREMAFKGLSLIGFAATVGGSVASLLVASANGGVWALVSASLVMVTIQSFGIIAVTRFAMWPSLRLAGMRQLFSFGAWSSGGRLAWFFGENADDLIIGKAFGSEVLGAFNVAKNLASLPLFRVMDILNQVTFPAYSRLNGDGHKALEYFLKSVWLGMLLFCPICWGFAAVADLFTSVVLGAKWESAAFTLHALALSIPLQALSSMLTPVVQALGRPDLSFRNALLRLVLYPLAIVVSIPFGIDMVVIALIGVRIASLLLFLRLAREVFPLSFWRLWQASYAPVMAGAGMYGIVALVGRAGTPALDPTYLLALACASGAVAFPAILLVVAPGSLKAVARTLA